jgi:ABC-type Fe3+ transport system permease subunit
VYRRARRRAGPGGSLSFPLYDRPAVVLVVASRLEGFDRSLEQAASDLRANTYQRLRHIVLPLRRSSPAHSSRSRCRWTSS